MTTDLVETNFKRHTSMCKKLLFSISNINNNLSKRHSKTFYSMIQDNYGVYQDRKLGASVIVKCLDADACDYRLVSKWH